MRIFIAAFVFIYGLSIAAQESNITIFEGEIFKSQEQEDKTYPVFRGCKKDLSFEETKKCTTNKILDYIKISFNYELADKAFPTDLTTQFQVEFVIYKKGKTEQISV